MVQHAEKGSAHSLNQQILLSICYVPGIVLDTCNTSVNKTNSTCPCGAVITAGPSTMQKKELKPVFRLEHILPAVLQANSHTEKGMKGAGRLHSTSAHSWAFVHIHNWGYILTIYTSSVSYHLFIYPFHKYVSAYYFPSPDEIMSFCYLYKILS